MSALMRDWIHPMVENELSKTLKTLEASVRSGRLDSQGPNTLTLKFKQNKAIQIIDVHDPVLATVSDGCTSILASFDEEAVQKALKTHGRDLSSFQGGVIIIEEFHIFLDLNKESSMSLTFKILRFKIKGSEGSTPFGKPIDILAMKNISTLMSQYKSRGISDMGSSPIRSQGGDIKVSQDLPRSSAFNQNGLATQVSEKPPQNIANTNHPKGGSLLAALTRTRPAINNTHKAIHTHTKATAVSEAASTSLPQSYQQDSMTTQKNTLHREKEQEHWSSNNAEAAYCGARERGPIDTAVAIPLTPQTFTLPPVSHDGFINNRANSQQSDHMRVMPEPKNQDSQHLLLKTCAKKANDQEKLDCLEAQNTESNLSQNLSCDAALALETEKRKLLLPFTDHFQSGSPFQGLKRIPRKFARIPESQQKLLDRSDSWFLERHQNQIAFAHIPPKVHDDLTSFMSRNLVLHTDYQAINSDTRNNSKDTILEETLDEGSEVESDDSNSTDSYRNANDVELPLQIGDELDIGSERCVSWPTSPVDPRQISTTVKSTPSCASPSPVSTASGQEAGQGIMSTVPQRSMAKQMRFPIAASLSSDSADEDDLEYSVPYAVGEVVENLVIGADSSPKFSQELPSTAPRNPKLVQVKQTPHIDMKTLNVLDEPGNICEETKENEVLSDYVPATFDDGKTDPDDEIPSPSLNDGCPLNTDQHEYNQESPQPNQVYDIEMIGVERNDEDEDEDFLAQTQLISEYSNSWNEKVRAVTPSAELDPSRNLEFVEGEEDDAASQINDDASFKSMELSRVEILRSTPEKHVSFNPNILKRSFEEIPEGQEKIIVKRRRRLKVAKMTEDPDPLVIDTKELARASRRSFRNELVATKHDGLQVPMSPRQDDLTSPGIPSTSPVDSQDFSAGSGGKQSISEFISIPNTQSSAIKAQESRLSSPVPYHQSSENSEIQDTSEEQDSEPDLPPKEPEKIEMKQSYNGHRSHYIGYDNFKAIYPQYSGSKRQFTWTLVYLEFLERSKQLQEDVYDDFIRIIASEYTPWCANTTEHNRIPGVKFYQQHACNPPIFQFHLVTPQTLKEHLLSLDPHEISKFRAKFNADKREDNIGSKAPYNSQDPRSNSRHAKTKDTASKKPFFETFSQLLGDAAPGNKQLPPQTPTSTIPRTPRNRKLPWASSSSVHGTDSRSPSAKQNISLDGKYRNHTDTQEKSSLIKTIPQGDFEGSPILGSLDPSTLQSHRSTVVIHTGSPLRKNTASIQPSSATPSNVSLEALNKLEDDNDADKVQDWINDQPAAVTSKKLEKREEVGRSMSISATKKTSFQKFLEKRRSSGSLISRSSTPDVKRKTSFCTKPKERPHVEPQTQQWSF